MIAPHFCEALLSVVLANAVAGGVAAGDDVPTGVGPARSGVLKVECLDRAGRGTPAVLSAVAIDGDGYLITVGLRAPGERKLCVRDCEGRRHDAEWIAMDEHSGLTLLKVQPGVGRPTLIADRLPELGSSVIVVGNPFGLSHSVSVGNVSGLNRSVSLTGASGRGLIQFTAPVHPGDSGGLLADSQGRMVGIVRTALVGPDAEPGAESAATGIGFAIPASEVRLVAERLRAAGKVERGYLGVTGENAEKAGVRITMVADGSPAQSAGLKADDVIVAINDEAVKGFDDLAARIEHLRPGTKIKLQVRRGDADLSLSATLAERKPAAVTPKPSVPLDFDVKVWDPDATARRLGELFGPGAVRWYGRSTLQQDGTLLGVETQSVSEAMAQSLNLSSTSGALVSVVIAGSPAEKAGLRVSDLIVAVNDEPVKSPSQLRERIQAAGQAAKITLAAIRDGKKEQFEATLNPTAAVRLWVPGELPKVLYDRESQRIEGLEARVKILEKRLEELEKRLQQKTGGGE